MTARHRRSTNGHSAGESESAVSEHLGGEPRTRGIAARVISAVLLMAVGLAILQRLNRGEEI
jgi:hypothetical protein